MEVIIMYIKDADLMNLSRKITLRKDLNILT